VAAALLEIGDGAVGFRHAILREAVLAVTVPQLVDGMHRRTAAALQHRDGPDARERCARHLVAAGEEDLAAAEFTRAAESWLADNAVLAADRAARNARQAARSPGVRAVAGDVLARALAAQGRWSEALDIDTVIVSEHGDTPARRLRRTLSALEGGRPELAESFLAEALAHGDADPQLLLASGRAALVRGDADRALGSAREVLASPFGGLEERLGALDLEGRAFEFRGERDAACASWERQAREALAAGRVQAQLRAVVQLGRLELVTGERPNRLREAVLLARTAGSLVELSWAEENLAAGLALRGQLSEALAVVDGAIERCRELRLDRLAYAVAYRAIIRSFVDEDVEDELAHAETLAPTGDLRLLTATQAWRAGGLGFLALYAHGILPGQFAWPAGLGDIAIGVTAPWVVMALMRNPGFVRSRAFAVWNWLGILDLVTAVTSGALSSGFIPGLRSEVTTAAMAELPMVLIPAYLVPLFIMFHATALLQARRAAA
jgi:hypothetical protein